MSLTKQAINRRIRAVKTKALRLAPGYKLRRSASTKLNPLWERVDTLTGMAYTYSAEISKTGRLKGIDFQSYGKLWGDPEPADVYVSLEIGRQNLLFRTNGRVPEVSDSPLVKTLETLSVILDANPGVWEPQGLANILDRIAGVAPGEYSTFIRNSYYGDPISPASAAFA